jgi:hypothetical protein
VRSFINYGATSHTYVAIRHGNGLVIMGHHKNHTSFLGKITKKLEDYSTVPGIQVSRPDL